MVFWTSGMKLLASPRRVALREHRLLTNAIAMPRSHISNNIMKLKAACKKIASFRGHFCEALVARNLLPKALPSDLLETSSPFSRGAPKRLNSRITDLVAFLDYLILMVINHKKITSSTPGQWPIKH